MGKHLVLVGAGHAHLTTLLRSEEIIGEGHTVTVVTPSPYHYYSGMAAGILGGRYQPQQARFDIAAMSRKAGVNFVADAAVSIDTAERELLLASGGKTSYDIISFNIGSEVPLEKGNFEGEGVIAAKPVENLYHARQRLLELIAKDHLKIAVIGGGPAGVEIAGNIWKLLRHARNGAEISLYCGKLLPDIPEKVRRRAFNSLMARKIRVVEGVRAQAIKDRRVVLTDRSDIPCDVAFIAIGVRAPHIFRDSGLPTWKDGGLLVNPFLQSVAHPEIFGGGDCIYFQDRPLPKVGVFAVRQAPILFQNLKAALSDAPLLPFSPEGDFLLIMNMGDGRGIAWRNGWSFDGHLALFLKEWIDRRFMKKHQIPGERGKPSS